MGIVHHTVGSRAFENVCLAVAGSWNERLNWVSSQMTTYWHTVHQFPFSIVPVCGFILS